MSDRTPDRSSPDDDLTRILEREDRISRAELLRTWQLASMGRDDEACTSVPAIADLKAVLGEGSHRRDDRPATKAAVRRTYPARRIAIVGALVATVLVVWTVWPVAIVSNNDAGIKEVRLSDGTNVWLNRGASIRYSAGLPGPKRNVFLDGEAYLEVHRGRRPFVVATGNGRIRVLGTKFSVRANKTDSVATTTVSLFEGQVSLSAKMSDAVSVILSPGQQSTVHGSTAPTAPRPFSKSIESIWISGGIAVVELPASSALDAIRERFDVNIIVDKPISLADTITWIRPQVPSAIDALRDVCALIYCSVDQVPGGFALHRPHRETAPNNP